MVARLEGVVGGLVRRMWPSTFEGLENLPSHNRFVIVANHSGMGVAELGALLFGWHDRFGSEKPVAGMAHPGAFRVALLRKIIEGLGAVEATRAGAAHALANGVPILLFPGGDHEASRPFWEGGRVDWSNRRGWIRLAREHGLTIVPMCITGSHRTLPILAHGRAVSWMIGLRFLGVHRAPLPALALVTAGATAAILGAAGAPIWLAGLLALQSTWLTMMLPWVPSRIGFHVLPPILPEEIGADEASDGAIYDRVTGELQATMDRENARSSAKAEPA